LYIGSITDQHGIIKFVKEFYINDKIPYNLYIIGGGEKEDLLDDLIKKNNLSKKIFYMGSRKLNEIINFLKKIDRGLFGIAPYSKEINDHVYYGDSLKIKEYLNYNLPFISSDVVYIPKNLRDFGLIYKNQKELNTILHSKLKTLSIDSQKLKKTMKEYLWENIFNKFQEVILI
jgi:hypothetical protein